MNLVVDANIIFSSLIKEGKTAELIFHISFRFFTPEFVLEEIKKHKQEILQKTKRSNKELEEILVLLQQVIGIIPKEEFQENLAKAKEISPDPDDIMYFALAL